MAKHVAVVGAGIIGASIAYHLATRGAKVTVIDGGPPGGLATAASFAWINASWGNPEFYFRFRMRSIARWRDLQNSLPALNVNWCGSLTYDLEPEKLEAFEREHGRWGYRLEPLARDAVARLEPNLASPPAVALLAQDEGAIEPAHAGRVFLTAATDLGATSVKATVSAVEARAVHLADRSIAADDVVVAAGTGSATLLPDLPLTAPPGLLVHSEPAPPLLRHLVIAPELHVRQTAAGRLVAGSDFAGADPGDDPAGAAAALFAKVKAAIRGAEKLELAFHTVGYRPTPKDGLPVIGRSVAGPYAAVMHSGITNAAAVGQAVAQEIVEGREEQLLAPFRPARLG